MLGRDSIRAMVISAILLLIPYLSMRNYRLADRFSKSTKGLKFFKASNGIWPTYTKTMKVRLKLYVRMKYFTLLFKLSLHQKKKNQLTRNQQLKLFLILESNEATKQNGMITELGLSVC